MRGLLDTCRAAWQPEGWVIDTPGKGDNYAIGLDERLRKAGIIHRLFCGVTNEVCVPTSMREANDRGYERLLIEGATKSYIARLNGATVAMLGALGGIVGRTAERVEVRRARADALQQRA